MQDFLISLVSVAFVLGIMILVTNPGPEHPPSPHFRTLKRVMKREEQIEKKNEEERK